MSYAARRIGEVPALAALLAVAGALAGCPSSAPSAFTSQNYGYSAALPAGWSSHQAGYKWPGLLSPSFEDSDVDLFTGPNGIVVMGYGTATPHSVSAYTKATVQAAAAHQCPAVPASDQAITVGGAPARLPSMRCQGLPIETAITIHARKPSCSHPKSHPARVPIVPPSADSSPAYGSSGDV